MSMEEKITFEMEDGSQAVFYVVEQTRINGSNYLLAADSDEEEAECLILKDLSEEDSREAIYQIVEDETELEAVMGVFAELLDDITLES